MGKSFLSINSDSNQSIEKERISFFLSLGKAALKELTEFASWEEIEKKESHFYFGNSLGVIFEQVSLIRRGGRKGSGLI